MNLELNTANKNIKKFMVVPLSFAGEGGRKVSKHPVHMHAKRINFPLVNKLIHLRIYSLYFLSLYAIHTEPF